MRYDFDGVTPLATSVSIPFDNLVYERNLFRPATYWTMTMPALPFESASSGNIVLNADVISEAGADSVDKSGAAYKYYYTADYSRNDNWCEVEAQFVDVNGATATVDGKTSGKFWVPLDLPTGSLTSSNFRANGGVFIPPSELSLEARGWYIRAGGHSVDISLNMNNPDSYVTQDYFTQYDPKLTFGSVSSTTPKVGTFPGGKELFIVFSSPAVRLVENHFEYNAADPNHGRNGTVVHEPTNTVVQMGETTYKKQALTTVPDMVCVGFEVLLSGGTIVKIDFGSGYVLPMTEAPDKSQLDLVYAEIKASDNINLYNEKPIINFYYEEAVSGIPISEVAYLVTRWRGEVTEGAYNMAAKSAERTATRVNREITRTNDDSAAAIRHISLAVKSVLICGCLTRRMIR